jgi:hypothetical protein
MAEHYKVGRSYTRRQRIRVALSDVEEVRAVFNAIVATDLTVNGRLADAEQWAAEHLRGAGLPVDPCGPPYSDPAWRRDNERKSLDWYAISILNTIRLLRKQIERGNIKLAVDFALDLGVLATEAKMIQHMTSNAELGCREFLASDKLSDIQAEHAAWCARADELWATKKSWGAAAIAKLIDPSRAETIRKVIGHRKPPRK